MQDAHPGFTGCWLFEMAACSAVLDACVSYPNDSDEDKDEEYAESDGGVTIEGGEMMRGRWRRRG